jgi:hypothetical protein
LRELNPMPSPCRPTATCPRRSATFPRPPSLGPRPWALGPRSCLPLSLALLLAGCAGGEDLTTRSLRAAQRAWEGAGLRDYDLEWASSGARVGRYRVFVRDGRVRAIYMVQPDGKEAVARPAEPRFFGVDGLFQVLEEELDQAQEDAPFGQPRGSRVVLKFTPDPKLGYPRDYRRDVLGGHARLAIDVLRLDPAPPAAIPPPRA